ncbi:MAG: RNA polymerase sigma factor [Prevotella sp.]|nr:RNA polymerase sigma factor [Prevotella sp.]
MREAFDEIVRQYQSPVRRFLLNLTLGDSQLSDDLAQDTFVKAYLHYDSFRGQASVQTWLMRIAYNVFYDYTRSRRQTVDVDVAPQRVSNENSSLKMDVYQALALLRQDERSCVTLQLIDGYDIAGIAKITGLKEGTVKSHLSRGKEKLANYLRQNGYDK